MNINEILYALMTNFIAQVSVDEARKGVQDTYYWYCNVVAYLNAMHDGGLFPEIESPNALGSDFQDVFARLGWPALGNMIDDYAGTDRWDVWPINPAVPD